MDDRPYSFMKRSFLLLILLPVLVASCTRKQETRNGMAADSVSVVDTSGSPQTAPVRALSYEERQGASLYATYCAVCHGQEGKGDGFNAYNLDPRPRDFSDSAYMTALSDEQIARTIAGGGRSVNKSPLMPAYGWTLSRNQIQYLEAYVRTFVQR